MLLLNKHIQSLNLNLRGEVSGKKTQAKVTKKTDYLSLYPASI